MSEEHVFDLLPAYALGSLDEDELIRVAGHLERCGVCRNELATYENTVDYLAQAMPLQTPPAGLKAKIMQKVERSAVIPPVAVVMPDGRQEQAHPRSFGALLRELLSMPAGMAAAVAALLIVVVLAGSNIILWQRVNQSLPQSQAQAQVIPTNAMRLINLAGTETAPQTRGYLMVFKNENYGTLVVEDAPPLQSGYQYQLWLVKDGKRISGGVFSVNGQGYGTLQVAADQPLEKFPSFGVTIEPAGGSPGPTGKKVLGGSL